MVNQLLEESCPTYSLEWNTRTDCHDVATQKLVTNFDAQG